MSVKVKYSNGVFQPLEEVRGATPGKIYQVFSEEELHRLAENLDWLKRAEKSFQFWNNLEDAVYDKL